ncbi:MAG: BamA/TamA family outer membrane protein [Phycisphaerales bacterium]|nr:BamA/TamA family outer membrane protein [Phycisphaerales bacterium]
MLLAGCLFLTALPQDISAQGLDLANRPVGVVEFEGLKQVPEALVRNQVRMLQGQPYNPALVQEDIVRLTHLGRFGAVTARVEPQTDGSIRVIFVVQELAMISDVLSVGNKKISDQEILKLSGLRSGDPVDQFLIQRAINQIKEAYEKEGHFQAEISVDQEQLDESGLLLFRVREGGMARLRDIRFEGNSVFEDDQLQAQIKSRTYFFILRKGEVNREQLESDAAKLRDFYRDAGYLDAQVGRRIDISPDQEDAVVVFVVSEGRQYTVDRIVVEGNELFSTEQILAAMLIKPGDVFTTENVRKSYDSVIDLYGKLGFIETKIQRGPGADGFERVFHESESKVDLIVRIDEGRSYTVGKMTVSGNLSTKDKVVLRQVRGLEPGRRFDRQGITLTEQRLKETPLFSDASVTVLGETTDEVRDVLVEVKEKQTGNISLGAGISSDAGVAGAIELTQRNFDIADAPESWGEFFSGKSFRGAGQFFSLSLQPGNEFSQYSISFRDPAFLETDYFLDLSAFYLERERDRYDETRGGRIGRAGATFRGCMVGSSWRLRGENIEVDNIDPAAPRMSSMWLGATC